MKYYARQRKKFQRPDKDNKQQGIIFSEGALSHACNSAAGRWQKDLLPGPECGVNSLFVENSHKIALKGCDSLRP